MQILEAVLRSTFFFFFFKENCIHIKLNIIPIIPSSLSIVSFVHPPSPTE